MGNPVGNHPQDHNMDTSPEKYVQHHKTSQQQDC